MLKELELIMETWGWGELRENGCHYTKTPKYINELNLKKHSKLTKACLFCFCCVMLPKYAMQ